jgi:hypothetical protein
VKAPATPIANEFQAAGLGDRRLDARLAEVGVALAQSPDASFPEVFGEDASQEAFYRLLRNPRLSLEKVLVPHMEATVLRMAELPLTLVLHDSSEFVFKGEQREGLFELRRGTYGFNGHLSLAVTADGRRHPLGTVAASVLDDAKSHRDRWIAQVVQVEERVGGRTQCIHVMDREADVYSLFAVAANLGIRFVVRARHDRLLAEVDEQERTLLEQLEHAEDVAEREVAISERRASKRTAMPDERKARPPRNSRIARLRFRACTVTLPRPQRQDKSLPKELKLNVVQVREVDAPKGVAPVEWLLATTEPIATREQILAIVDAYRARWTIEEFFKALKTGCAYESRQLESYGTLSVALGIFLPLAWHLLLLRSYGHLDSVGARAVMDDRRLKVLAAMAKKRNRPLPPNPTARDVMLAVAALGGHIKQNGDPGWQVLWRGYKRLLETEEALILYGDL